jgi:hypothetical protein
VGDKVQRVVALRVGDVWVRAMCDEQLYDVEVAVTCGPLERGCDEIAANSVDFCALCKKVAARGELSVDSSPMERCDVLLITVCCACFSRGDKSLESLKVTSLGSNEDVDLS